MMFRKYSYYLLLVLICFSCSSDDTETAASPCALVDCAPVSLALQFVSAETGEDLLFNQTFSIEDLQIRNIQTDTAISFGVGTSDAAQRTVITLPTFVESSDLENYLIAIPEVFEVALSFSVEVTSDPCCIGNEYNNVAIEADGVSIENADFAFYKLIF